jgi:hypothetical protein
MSRPEIQDLSALEALGLLDPEEARAFRLGLHADAALQTDLNGFQFVAGALGLGVPPVAPPPELKQRLMNSIAASPEAKSDSPAKLPEGLAALARANEMPWKPTPFPGIRSKRLYTNNSDGTTVWLVNMAPGSVYPPHSHTAIEHTFVVEGDIVFDGYSLCAGEYQAALPGKDHDKPITTKGGCTVLIINNAHDEVFACTPAV